MPKIPGWSLHEDDRHGRTWLDDSRLFTMDMFEVREGVWRVELLGRDEPWGVVTREYILGVYPTSQDAYSDAVDFMRSHPTKRSLLERTEGGSRA